MGSIIFIVPSHQEVDLLVIKQVYTEGKSLILWHHSADHAACRKIVTCVSAALSALRGGGMIFQIFNLDSIGC